MTFLLPIGARVDSAAQGGSMESIINKYKDKLIDEVQKTVNGWVSYPDNDTFSEQIRYAEIELPDGFTALVDIDVWGYCYTRGGSYDNPPLEEAGLEYSVPLLEIYDKEGELVESAKNVEFLKFKEDWKR